MKKILSVFISLLLLFSLSLPAEAKTESVAVCVMHKGSGTVCTDINAMQPMPCAGLAHMGALLVISEAIDRGEFDLKSTVSVSSAASRIPGATAFIEANEAISAESLYKAAVIIGAGDALYALGEAVGGGSDKFTELVNDRMRELGTDAVYSDIVGTDLDISALDLARIGAALSDCKCYLEYSSVYMDSIEHSNGKKTELVNQNRLVRDMPGCKGLLTGSSNKAGYCGAFYTERNSCGYVCVVLGESNSQKRADRAKTGTEGCFAKYKETKIAEKDAPVLIGYPVSGACSRSCDIVALKDVSILTEQGIEHECTYNIPDKLTAPIKAGDCIGNAIYTDENGNMLASVELTVKDDVPKAGFLDFIKAIARILYARG